ncbi:MAG: hypothetical protein M1819_006503 [Sarea resinae]|nr:MAG: hypothetical protein M1819_006503 [Sarea resinae]
MASSGPQQPSMQDGQFMLSVIRNMKNKPDIDFEAVANELGYKNGSTASVRFGQIKRKLGYDKTAEGSTAASAKSGISSSPSGSPSKVVKPRKPVTPRKPRGKKAIEACEQALRENQNQAMEDTNTKQEINDSDGLDAMKSEMKYEDDVSFEDIETE